MLIYVAYTVDSINEPYYNQCNGSCIAETVGLERGIHVACIHACNSPVMDVRLLVYNTGYIDPVSIILAA